MLRQVIVPSEENPTISIPAEFYGTKVEVLVFPFHEPGTKSDDPTAERNGYVSITYNRGSDRINEIFDRHLYSFGNYKFDRDDANDYE